MILFVVLGLAAVLGGVIAMVTKWHPKGWRGSQTWMYGAVIACLGAASALYYVEQQFTIAHWENYVAFLARMAALLGAVFIAVIARRQGKAATGKGKRR